MINLLPPETKEEIVFARRNRLLLQWLGAMIAGVLGIATVIAAGHLYMNYSIKTYAKSIEQDKASLKAQKVDETEKRVEEIGSSIKLSLQVLSREVKFSKLLPAMGAAIPKGTALQNLSLDELTGAIDLQFVAADYNTATQTQLNLQDKKNKIFEKADMVNVSCAESTEPGNVYPCQVTIRALFAKDSPYIVTTPGAIKK